MPLILSPTQAAFNPRGDGRFNTPFQEQLDFFRQKLNLPTQRYDDILGAAHDRAFVVAGAMKADLLSDLRESIDQAIAEGNSIQQFRREFQHITEKHGWLDYTGSDSKKGRDWRTRIIYRTNLATSYAAGRYQQLTDPELLKRRPYWKYIHNDSVRHPRPLHVSWNGRVLKHDDPWWTSHFPPNGWGCRCRVKAVRASEYKHAQAPDDGEAIHTDRAGKTHHHPKGIDFGWDYAPGRTWTPQIEKYPYALASQIVTDYVRDGVINRWHERITDEIQTLLKQTEYKDLKQDALVRALRSDRKIPNEEVTVAVLPDALQSLLKSEAQGLLISADTLSKQIIKRQNQAIDASHYIDLQAILNGTHVLKKQGDNKIVIWSSLNELLFIAIKTTLDKKQNYLISVREANLKEARRKLTHDERLKLGIS